MLDFPDDLLGKLVQVHGSPLLVGSRAIVRKQFQRMRQTMPTIDWLYAVKANCDTELIETLTREGAGFDVASYSEWQKIHAVWTRLGYGLKDVRSSSEELGCVKSIDEKKSASVLHSHPCKTPGDIDACYKAGIRSFVFDCESELIKLATQAPDARLLLRINVPHRSGIVAFSHRFGADLELVVPLAKQARKLGFPIEGIAFHIGSQAVDPSDFEVALAIARLAWNQLTNAGFQLSILDIGGGFPVAYRDQKTTSFEAYGCAVNRSLEKHFGDQMMKIIAEPGRLLSADGVSLVVTIIGKQRRQGKQWYTIDDGRYGSFSGRYFSDVSFDFYPCRARHDRLEPSMIAGPSCDGGDIVATDYPLPELEVGDLIVVTKMGAYSTVSASDFNGIPRAKSVWID